MPLGNWTWFDLAVKKQADHQFTLTTDDLKIALTTSAQALDRTFLGGSGDARYADLTAELTTAGGYTAGGASLSGLALARTANVTLLNASNISWIITSTITFKYAVLYDNSLANKDLIAFLDTDTTNSSASTSVGTVGSPLVLSFPSGLLKFTGV